jgi:hypothetical protein
MTREVYPFIHVGGMGDLEYPLAAPELVAHTPETLPSETVAYIGADDLVISREGHMCVDSNTQFTLKECSPEPMPPNGVGLASMLTTGNDGPQQIYLADLRYVAGSVQAVANVTAFPDRVKGGADLLEDDLEYAHPLLAYTYINAERAVCYLGPPELAAQVTQLMAVVDAAQAARVAAEAATEE